MFVVFVVFSSSMAFASEEKSLQKTLLPYSMDSNQAVGRTITLVYDEGKQIAAIDANKHNVPALLKDPTAFQENLDNLNDPELAKLFDVPETIEVTEEAVKENSIYPYPNDIVDTHENRQNVQGVNTVDTVTVQLALQLNYTSSPYLKIKIIGITGTPPIGISGSISAYRSQTEYGSYSYLDTLTVNWTAGQIWVGNSVTKTLNLTSTYYYSFYYSYTSTWTGPYVDTASGSDLRLLVNKAGMEYPFHYGVDVNGFLNVAAPDTNYATVPSSTVTTLRNTFNNTVRDKYKTYYDTNYGYVNWSNAIEIHHIRPLQYGGTNDYSNLIPLYADKHAQFTSWWTNY
ncbi:HNH endonuclease signature motif containing protein [Cohnella cellulosilytica]